MPAPASRQRSGAGLAVPAVVLVLLFLVMPLTLIVRYSLDVYDPVELMRGVFSLETYAKVFSERHYRDVLLRTAWISAVTTGGTLILAIPVAYLVSRVRSVRWRNILMALMIVPMMLGNGVRSAAWMLLLGSKGMVNSVLASIGAQPLELLYTPVAVVIALVAVLVPFAVIVLVNVFDAIAPSLEEAAQCLGCSPFGAFARAVLPLAIPGLLSAGAMAFGLAMNSYATPVLIGGPSVQMMGPLVYEEIAKTNNWPTGSALACALMVVTIALTAASTLFVLRRRS